MAAITKTPSATWKAIIRKRRWPTSIKTFRTKHDAQDWARRTDNEMVRGVFIDRAGSDYLLLKTCGKFPLPRSRAPLMLSTIRPRR